MSAPTGTVVTAGTFESAIRVLLPALRGYARRLTRDPAQSEDLVQETLLRAWAARHRYIPDTNLKAWLFRIELNCFLSVLRKSRRIEQLSPEMAEVRLTAPALQEEGLMMRDLARALATLPRDQADALALINDERFPYEDAAARLGIALGTMKSRTARARAAVTKFLSGETPPPAIHHASITKQARDRPVSEPARSVSQHGPYAAWKASGQRFIG